MDTGEGVRCSVGANVLPRAAEIGESIDAAGRGKPGHGNGAGGRRGVERYGLLIDTEIEVERGESLIREGKSQTPIGAAGKAALLAPRPIIQCDEDQVSVRKGNGRGVWRGRCRQRELDPRSAGVHCLDKAARRANPDNARRQRIEHYEGSLRHRPGQVSERQTPFTTEPDAFGSDSINFRRVAWIEGNQVLIGSRDIILPGRSGDGAKGLTSVDRG
jgi:hypothetical protein